MPTANDLYPSNDFVSRHIGPSNDDISTMLATVGAGNLDELIDQTLPPEIRQTTPLALPGPQRETDVIESLRALAAKNRPMVSLIGMGYVDTVMPPVIARNVFENPAWYTAYTPYQPEISQGRLEAMLNFQTMVADLTGLPIANASLLDEATAAAEAMAMARRVVRGDRSVFFVHHDVHPQTLGVLRTRAEPVGIELVVGEIDQLPESDDLFGALFSYPTSTGAIHDWRSSIDRVHALGAQAVVATDLAACVLLRSPGELGADIAVGSAQRFGVPMGFGGPHAAFIAVSETAARLLPGRLVGVSTDSEGRPALRLALQTREQHIRRERATSNICTAQALLASIAGLYAVWHGPDGLRRISHRIAAGTTRIANAARRACLAVRHDTWFDTVTIDNVDVGSMTKRFVDAGMNLRIVDDRAIGITIDETTAMDTVDAICSLLTEGTTDPQVTHDVVAERDINTNPELKVDAVLEVESGIPSGCRRSGPLLEHDVFRRYHSEHEMLRYVRRLSDRDLALDRTMIPLGSCTMKLNATTEMLPVSWPEFARIHPYAPHDQTVGYREMIEQLEHSLAAITGYDRVSVQPNAGSQGELAGLLAIRAYHRSRGEAERTVCLIPASAHGTNAASAVMAGMSVVVVACDEAGNVDPDDLRASIERAGGELSCIMVTYPSTHGVYEDGINEICALVHAAGGQVYVDGANLNALVGLAQPGKFGADVSHLNLHKTFCIPHGGGGPGVGPVAVREHLAPFLPGNPLDESPNAGPVSAAPFGSAGILPISWVYIELMGAAGLRRATEVAILAANYVACRLAPEFPVLYTGRGGRVAHECIIDLRPLTRLTGVTVDDVAKRLIDYGFHAPTMSFPVAGTLMIEPTESESLEELDRFCDAMLAIRGEIEEIASGGIDLEAAPLRRAPHTAIDLVTDWDRSYSPATGGFPGGSRQADKYFPPVSRIDGAYGDRHLVCDCAPLEAYAER